MNVLLLVLATLAIQAVTSADIPSNHESLVIDEKSIVFLNGTRYYFSRIDGNLGEAEYSCNTAGMVLISLETEAKVAVIWNYLVANYLDGNNYYTSGIRVDKSFMWARTGKYFDYFNWAVDEPNEPPFPNQACITYWGNKLYDDPCTSSLYFICEDLNRC